MPASYAISSGLLKAFMESSIQDIPKSEIEKLEREEKKLLVALEANLPNLIYDSSGDEMDPSIYTYMSQSEDENEKKKSPKSAEITL